MNVLVRKSIQVAAFVFLTACAAQMPDQMASQSPSKVERPLPNPVEIPQEYQSALEAGTRTESGKPGDSYWMNTAMYTINVSLNPAEKKATATEMVEYTNNSNDTLRSLGVNLNLNLHKEGVVRNEAAEVTGGMPISLVKYNGVELPMGGRSGARYVISGTLMRIVGDAPVAPGETVMLEFEWEFKIPKEGASGRMGWSRDNLFYLAYFYPQMAVYDDVIGWHMDQFQGTAEFYADFADYNVTVEAPANWLVLGTGELTNAKEVLQENFYEKMVAGYQTDSVTHVITKDDFGNVTKAKTGETVKWNFRANMVRDVAFSITSESNWDVTRSPIGDINGDGVTDYSKINAVWRETAFRWAKSWQYAQHSIDFLSRHTGVMYPWPHMTVVEAEEIINGGMEYPMMTIIGSYNRSSDAALYGVTAHEIAHMWFPLMVNNNERRYAWMDEGTTSFNENQASKEFFEDFNTELSDKRGYIYATRLGIEGEIMRWSDYHYNGFAYGTASYSKPSTVLATLRGVLGEEVFTKAFKAFFKRWQFKHPYPWDMWATFEDVSGRDLSWFWTTWYFETWKLEQGIESVEVNENGETVITIIDNGNAPMPTPLTISFADETFIEVTLSEQVWLKGVRKTTHVVPAGKKVVAVQLDPKGLFPDVDTSNNNWMQK